MNNHFFFSLFISLIFLNTNIVKADVPVEVKRYFNCHERFTSTRAPLNDPRVSQIKAGTLTGTAACMQLWDEAALLSDNKVDINNTRALKLLRKLHEVHRGFLSAPDFFNAMDENSTANLIDTYESANAWTYFALKPNQTFSQILTDPKSYRSIRQATANSTVTLTNPYVGLSFAYQDANYADVPYTPTVIAKEGLLQGFQQDTAVNINPSPLGGTGFTNTNMNVNTGAGIIGTQSYLDSTIARLGFQDNGGTYHHRRWAKYVYKDLLCRDLPLLRVSDVTAEVSTSSPLPFRNGASCVTCHSSMDKMASAIRNHKSRRSSGSINGITYFAVRTPTGTDLSSDPVANVFPTSDDGNFYTRAPKGWLYYRSYDGTLVSVGVNGLNDLATRIAEKNDFYACTASKYYKFLTGISVNLGDVGNTEYPLNLTAGGTFHRNNVIQYGLNLKSSQSIRSLIQEIISSNAFVSPNLGQ